MIKILDFDLRRLNEFEIDLLNELLRLEKNEDNLLHLKILSRELEKMLSIKEF
jgi:hypothetical protein